MFNLFNKFFKSCVLFLEPWITYFIPSSLALLSTILDFLPVNIATSPPSFNQFTRAKPSFTLKALKADGLFVQQTESPMLHQPLVEKVFGYVKELIYIATSTVFH